ncbi:anti-Muellerian hormone type-2 receptor isoform X2 [Parus major]|uniref:anti-Muellerian hormone type-2 receptor isoform X2 n=1 Tax=Parus major TaxID=9157 RepID=UPI0007715130|nr:anti-Muellerian hormone type-2 receptor isoform X2 [Parus major]
MGRPGCWGGRGDACPSATCAPSPAGHPGSSVLLCLCHGHLCNGNATGTAAVGLGGTRQGPVPGQGGSVGTLWLWGAGPLLLILLTCLGILGRDRSTAGTGGPPGTAIPYPMSPGCPQTPHLWCSQSAGPQVLCHPVPGAGVPAVLVTPWGGEIPGCHIPRVPCVVRGAAGPRCPQVRVPDSGALLCGGSPDGGVPGVPHPGLRRTRARTGQPPRRGRRIGVPPEPPSPDLPALHFLQVLQSGRFSAVWRGTLRQRPVAIKAFAAGAGRRFAAERAVHALPLMEHENVARLLDTRAAGPRARGGLLVLQLYPAGSLRHFLGQHVGTWAGSVRLALSLARGLAFLHQELWRDGLYKPSVVHRDLSSQNVLVREDGTCAIGDFGLALALPPRAQDGTGARHAVTIRKAGTQRYLAPEILDESLDLRAWGRALRQADVYALSLLLWEILSRCQALSPGAPVPPFRLAYEAELGSSPSGAQLRRLAADERRRPLIPPAWHRAPQVRPPGPRAGVCGCWGRPRGPRGVQGVPGGLGGSAPRCPGVFSGGRCSAMTLRTPGGCSRSGVSSPGVSPAEPGEGGPTARGGSAGAAGGLLGPGPRGAALGRAGSAAAPALGRGARTGPGGPRRGGRPPSGPGVSHHVEPWCRYRGAPRSGGAALTPPKVRPLP